eukprot:3002491-Karenia_brevis.AAC.1
MKGSTDEILEIIADMFISKGWGPKAPSADPVRWTRRDGNKEADWLVNESMDARRDFEYAATGIKFDWTSINLVAYIDGGSRPSEGISASAWLLKAFDHQGSKPVIIAASSTFHAVAAKHSLAIETEAMLNSWRAIRDCEGKFKANQPDVSEKPAFSVQKYRRIAQVVADVAN